MEMPLLLAQGISSAAIYAELDKLEAKLASSGVDAQQQFEATFGALDRNHDSVISLDEWEGYQDELPESYRHLRLMFGGMIRCCSYPNSQCSNPQCVLCYRA